MNTVLLSSTAEVLSAFLSMLQARWVFPGGSGYSRTLPAVQEPQEPRVQSLGWEDPLEKELATHSSILDWEIPWTEEPGRLQSVGSQRVRQD